MIINKSYIIVYNFYYPSKEPIEEFAIRGEREILRLSGRHNYYIKKYYFA